MKREVVQSIEEVLNNYGSITYKVSGKSMEPMIFPNKDIVTIKRKVNSTKLYENKEDAKTYWLIISKINIYNCLLCSWKICILYLEISKNYSLFIN